MSRTADIEALEGIRDRMLYELNTNDADHIQDAMVELKLLRGLVAGMIRAVFKEGESDVASRFLKRHPVASRFLKRHPV